MFRNFRLENKWVTKAVSLTVSGGHFSGHGLPDLPARNFKLPATRDRFRRRLSHEAAGVATNILNARYAGSGRLSRKVFRSQYARPVISYLEVIP
jgi:hypothetical protein